MEKNEFIEAVVKSLKAELSEGYNISIRQVPKNNGVKLNGLLISRDGDTIIPTIYLDDFYYDYLQGQSLNDITKEVLEIYYRSKPKQDLDISYFDDYEQVKDKICLKIISYSRNKKFLKEVPHRKFLDLAVVYYCSMENSILGDGAILVYNAQMNTWNVTEEILYAQAVKNTEALYPAICENIISVLNRLHELKYGDPMPLTEDMQEQEADMWILTNSKNCFGASVILYPNVLKNIAENVIKDDMYVIPSSIHELILIKASAASDKQFLKDMIFNVNSADVDAGDVLSDMLYFYSKKTNTLKRA